MRVSEQEIGILGLKFASFPRYYGVITIFGVALQVMAGPLSADAQEREQARRARLWFEAGIVSLEGIAGEDSQAVLLGDEKVEATTRCFGYEGCTLSVEEAKEKIAAKPEKWEVVLVPRASEVQKGELLAPSERLDSFGIDVVFSDPLFTERTLDTGRDSWLLVPRVGQALEKVACERVICRRTEQGVLLFQPAPGAASVRLTYVLKPGYFRQFGGKLVASETLTLRLERCAVEGPTWPLLAGVASQRLHVAIPQGCVPPARLEVQTSPPTGAWVRGEMEDVKPGHRVIEINLDSVPQGISSLTVTLLDGDSGRRIGSSRVSVAQDFAPREVRILVPGIGPVGFIPSNRDGEVALGFSDPVWFERFQVVDRPGFYKVRQEGQKVFIRGEPGVLGHVPLRLAYRPSRDDRSGSLALYDTSVVYPVRTVNLPLPLAADPDQRFYDVKCGPPGGEKALAPGLTRIAYKYRDTCRIIFYLSRVPAEAGIQRLKVTAGSYERLILVEHADGLLTLSIGASERREYEIFTVSVAHDMTGDHYALGKEQRLGEEARYRILLSDDYFRISATTSLPTGLFRFGKSGSGETVPLSAGALIRFAYVQQEGRDFPVTLEAGMFGTNLSGSAHLSVVTGLGLTIPVLNPDTPAQASFNIHAWFEYSPTRARAGLGSIAFLFGPSFTIGRISTTF